jgi:hypothetical protein
VKTPKVRLYIRVRRSDGRYAYHDPAWNRNRTLRANYALVNHHRVVNDLAYGDPAVRHQRNCTLHNVAQVSTVPKGTRVVGLLDPE